MAAFDPGLPRVPVQWGPRGNSSFANARLAAPSMPATRISPSSGQLRQLLREHLPRRLDVAHGVVQLGLGQIVDGLNAVEALADRLIELHAGVAIGQLFEPNPCMTTVDLRPDNQELLVLQGVGDAGAAQVERVAVMPGEHLEVEGRVVQNHRPVGAGRSAGWPRHRPRGRRSDTARWPCPPGSEGGGPNGGPGPTSRYRGPKRRVRNAGEKFLHPCASRTIGGPAIAGHHAPNERVRSRPKGLSMQFSPWLMSRAASMSRIIGIDLGTTNSCAAVVEGIDQKVKLIPYKGGEYTIPSIYAVDDKGNELVGHEAKRQWQLNPKNTIYGSKRLMGKSYDPDTVRRIHDYFVYEVHEAPGTDEVLVGVSDKRLALPQVAAKILQKIQDRRLGLSSAPRSTGRSSPCPRTSTTASARR